MFAPILGDQYRKPCELLKNLNYLWKFHLVRKEVYVSRYKGESPWRNKDWLYTEYVVKDRSTKEIAEEYGCKQNTIQCWLIRHGIKKQITKHNVSHDKQYQQKQYLYEHHIVMKESIADIAKNNGVSGDIIRYWLENNGIEYWVSQPKRKYSSSDIDKIVEMYVVQRMSAFQIAKYFNTSHGVIIRYMKRRGIETRNIQESQFAHNDKDIPDNFFNPDILYELHWIQQISCQDIGKILGISSGTVRRQMHRLGIPTKTNSQSKFGLQRGKNHPNWKGGITPLTKLLREFFHTNQVPVIAKRDNYTCQLCGKTHVALHVHHIIPFSDIVGEICLEHIELDPNDVQQRLELYNIIVSDKRFLDENNLITYCRNCHFYKIHKFKTISNQASKEEGSETIQ